mgnify:CR=1 FL=1
MLSKFWINLTAEEIKKLGKNIVLIFPFSSIEQHGNHLPVGTDKIILDGILENYSKKKNISNNFVIMPIISIGSASEHSSFEGTISIKSSEYINYITKFVEQFCIKKYKKFLFLNSHGGQINHLEIIAKELKSRYKSIDIVKANYFLFEGFKNIISSDEIDYGYHGGEFETSLMLYLKPNLVKNKLIKRHKLSPDHNSKSIISFEKNIKRAWNTKDLNKTGIIGNPINSSKNKGYKIVEVTISTIDKIIKEMTLKIL